MIESRSQRVTEAAVAVDGETKRNRGRDAHSRGGPGRYRVDAAYLADKVANLRIFLMGKAALT